MMISIRLAFLLTVIWPVVAQTCLQYGTTGSGSDCLCPPGFNPSSGGNGSCSLPVCGGSLYEPAAAAPGGTGGFGDVSSNCDCTTGWSGPGCTVCQSSDACTASIGQRLSSNTSPSPGLDTSLTCSTTPFVYSSSQLSCSVVQSTVQSLFPGEVILTITRTLNSSLTPGGGDVLSAVGLTAGDSVGYAQLWLDGIEQFYCQASQCVQSSDGAQGGNQSTWDCADLQCTCRTGTTFCSSPLGLSTTIDSLTGPLTIACQGSTCNFKQTLLDSLFGSDGLPLSSCIHGECVQQFVIDQAEGNISNTSTSDSSLSGGVIAGLAVVGVIILAILALIIWGLVMRKNARSNMRTDGVLPKAGGVAVTWSNVGYEVKSTQSNAWTRSTAWLRGSGSRGSKYSKSNEEGDSIGPNGGKIVLRDVHGQLPAGGFCAILGPSGAGKSTLVDVLAGKRKSGKVQGRVGFSRRNGSQGRVKIGYVDQSDVLSPTATVLETLIFAAQLRLPENIPKSVKIERAHTVLSQLGLTDVAHTRVGSVERRGISGGEMRRVSIGIELVAAPDVLVLDEPTSGLDSVSASRLVKLLKSLTEDEDSKTTIIASIHQPSSALYHSFSQVVLLSNGRQLYFGPGGSKPAEFFGSQGRPCPQGYNVADHLLEIASGSSEGLTTGQATLVGGGEGGTGSRQSSNDASYSNSKHGSERRLVDSAKQGMDDDDGPGSPSAEKNISYPPSSNVLLNGDGDGRDKEVDLAELGEEEKKREWWPKTHCATTFLTQMEVLSGREWRNLKRDKTLLIAHVVLACILGVFAGGLYYQVGVTIAGFQNRVGSLFFLGSLIAFSSLSALYNLVEVRGLFLRERAGSFYSSQAWLLSRVLFDVIPLRLIPTILVGVIVYFMVGLASDASRFFKFLLIIVEFSIAMVLFNFLLACVFRHGGIAILLSSLCNLFLMTYAGFFVNIAQIPPVLRWLRYFSTLGYTLEALAINEVGSGLQIVDTLAGVNVEINAVIIMQTLFGFELGNYYRDVLVLFAYIAGHGILLVLVVVFFLRERR